MADDDKPTTLEAPMAVWVKGGTTSMQHDVEQQRQAAEAEARRDAEAERHRIALANPMEARMHTMSLANRQRDAMVVLGFKHAKDNKIDNWMTCELYRIGDAEHERLVLQICCPYCVSKHGRSLGQSQYHIHQDHRDFSLDQRTREQRKEHPLGVPVGGDIWINPENVEEVIKVAGTITTHGWIRCDGLGCTWSFRIDDSVIITRST
jgi:hypothetical protein